MRMSFVSLVLMLTACQNSDGWNPDWDVDPIEPHAFQYVWILDGSTYQGGAVHELEGMAPLEIGTVLGVQWPSTELGGRWDEAIERIELDFGDGTGKIDVTAESVSWDQIFFDGVDLSRVSRHTYSMPGVYSYWGRVFFTDGRMVITPVVTIRVSPAEN